jgi:transcription initiation factor TFIID TATA-box-binding protein
MKIVNVIASTKILGDIDVELLSVILKNNQYEPGIFPGLVYRKEKYTIIMFSSGKISSHGTKSESEAKKAIDDTLKEIKKIGGIIGDDKYDKINIENIVGSGELSVKLNLESLIKKLPFVIYEPEQFPGLIYRPTNNSIVCLIFNSGKVVIVGTKSKKKLEQVYFDLDNKLKDDVE